ncbi:MAG: thioesterase family protein [Chloroflexota bacterium]|nr:thioesterase family protein [Chloroflexota bacterium]
MTAFSYYHPITVRYRDLDPQGHVNNTVYLTYLESARLGYYQQAGIYHPDSRILTGMVVVRNEIDYLAPIRFREAVKVGLRVERMGTKSITFAFQIETDPAGVPLARGKSVMVVYDNAADRGIPIPSDWREKINQYEEKSGTA